MTNEKKTRRLFSRKCAVCGCTFTTPRCEREFCGDACKNEFNNRRRDRGSEVYDILMMCRFERDLTKEIAKTDARFRRLDTILSNLAGHYRDADKSRRAGRKSWKSDAYKRLPLSYDATGGDGR